MFDARSFGAERWRIALGGLDLAIDLAAAPLLDQAVRRFLTIDVQRPDRRDEAGRSGAGAGSDASLTATRASPPPRPEVVDVCDGMAVSWGADALWCETPAGVLAGRAGVYRLHRADTCDNDPYVPVVTFLSHVGVRAGWNSLHSALVNTPAGGMLLVGRSGRGKSSTSAIALGMGWQVESDDLTFLRRDVGHAGAESRPTVMALGMPRSLSVPDEAIPAHLLASASTGIDHRNRRTLQDIDRMAQWLPLVAVVGIDHGTADESRLEELTALELVQELMRNQAVAGSIPGRDAELARLVEAMTILPRFRLALGRDAGRRRRSTEVVLQTLVTQLGARPATAGDA